MKLSVISDSLDKSQKIHEGLQMDRHTEKVVRWLAAPDCSSNFSKALETRHAGSGRKLMETAAYIRWRKNPGSFLWLNGIPGCGKTILASIVIEALQTDPKCAQNPLYYFFDFTVAKTQTFNSAIRSLAAQLYLKSGRAKGALNTLYSVCQNGEEQPTMSLLKSTFASMIEKAGETWIVIDALDECLPRHDLLAWLRDIRAEQLQSHVLVTSRPEQDIDSAFRKICRDQEIIAVKNDLLKDDISIYVQARVREHESLSRWHRRPDVQREIENNLIEKANGM